LRAFFVSFFKFFSLSCLNGCRRCISEVCCCSKKPNKNECQPRYYKNQLPTPQKVVAIVAVAVAASTDTAATLTTTTTPERGCTGRKNGDLTYGKNNTKRLLTQLTKANHNLVNYMILYCIVTLPCLD